MAVKKSLSPFTKIKRYVPFVFLIHLPNSRIAEKKGKAILLLGAEGNDKTSPPPPPLINNPGNEIDVVVY